MNSDLLLIRVAEVGQPFRTSIFVRRIEAPDRLAKEQVAAQIRRQPVAAIDLAAAGRREMVQRLVRPARSGRPPCTSAMPHERPHFRVSPARTRPSD